MKRFVLYFLGLVVFGLCIAIVLEQGRGLAAPKTDGPSLSPEVGKLNTGVSAGPAMSLLANLRENAREPLARLFTQLILIILVARLCGAVAVRIHQPAVIGEMVAGILLGPSLLGWLWPGVFHLIFAASSLGVLRLLSQIGICLFMFVVGMELDASQFKQQARTAMLVSQVSIAFPYLLGVVASIFLFTTFAGPKTTFPAFALFVGISMSITAFPVLARIMEERGLIRTPLGATALICAAMNDVAAWSILAVVVAVAKAASVASAAFSIGLVVVFVCGMLFWIKPRLPAWIGRSAHEGGAPGKSVTAGVLVFLFASALATDVIGIHALFGAFLAGVVMPAQGGLREYFKVRLENFSSIFLLPLFFAITGLHTQVGLLNDAGGWLVCLGLILLATLGKLGGATVTARLTGMSWGDSFMLGTLMNTRGLVELIALNIGDELGIISPRIFTMLVVMALFTTCMTGPLLTLGDYLRARKPLAATAAG